MVITETIIQYITTLISSGGYFFVFFLMILESTALPVPSEAVMPFAGFLIFTGQFSFLGVIVFSALGSIVGSLISYYIGFYEGKPFILKFGKYFLLKPRDLVKAENFFGKHGEKTIFISRFIPIIRHLISLPAGAAKMKIFKFSIYTITGATLWNTFLAWAGFSLKQNWQKFDQYAKYFDYIFLIAIIIFLTIFIYKRKKSKYKKIDPSY
ncbi:MAG: DedA family protein [Candidatus Pacebacteria bacterium]|nr:DedA family protein [Candidatus Paceibacterota bacterium]